MLCDIIDPVDLNDAECLDNVLLVSALRLRLGGLACLVFLDHLAFWQEGLDE